MKWKMTRYVAAFMAFIIAVSAGISNIRSMAEGNNLIVNELFADEDGDGKIDGWSYWSNTASSRGTAIGDNGELSIEADNGNLNLYQMLGEVEAGKTYRFCSSMKTEGFSKGAGIIRYQLMNGTRGLKTIELAKITSNRNWFEINESISIPDSVNEVEVTGVKLELMLSSPSTGIVRFRDISWCLEEEIEETLIKNPVYADRDGDGKIDNWNYYAKAGSVYSVSTEQETACVETNAAYLTLHQTVKTDETMVNKSYRFTGEIRTENLSGGYATFRIQLVNASNSSLGSFDAGTKLQNTTNWTPIEITFDVPEEVNNTTVAGIKIEQIVTQSTGISWFKNPILVVTGDIPPVEIGDPVDTLVFNGGYEKVNGNMPASWNLWQSTGGLTASIDRDIFKSGTASVRLSNVTEHLNSRGTIHQTFGNIPEELQGQSLKISQWVKSDGFIGKGLSIRLQFEALDGTKPELSSKAVEIASTQDWTEYVYTFDLPSVDLRTIKVEYLYDESQGEIWLDDTRVEAYIKAKRLEISPASLAMKPQEQMLLSAATIPSGATIQELIFTSSAPQIVQVDDAGRINAIAEGAAVIQVSHEDGCKKEIGILVDLHPAVIPPQDAVHTVMGSEVKGTLVEGKSYEVLARPQNGTFLMLDSVSYVYYPDKGFWGSDSVTLLVYNEDGTKGLLDLTLIAEEQNQGLVFEDFMVELKENETAAGILKASAPGNTLIEYQVIRSPQNGSMEIEGYNYRYYPNENFNGYDSAVIRATDVSGNIAEVTVTIYVAASVQKLIDSVKNEHPRMLAGVTEFELIQSYVKEDEKVKSWYSNLVARVDQLLDAPVVPYELPDGVRLNTQGSKNVVDLAFVYKISGEDKYLERAWEELESLCKSYPDWHPDHLLDTAMTANGVAIAYDWLYHDLTAEQRSVVEAALYEKCLVEAKKQYQANHRFVTDGFNWNFVCNTGFTAAALTLAHHENPDYAVLSGEILQRAYRSIQYGLPQYAPFGESIEGISYWDYGTRYLVSFLASVSSATVQNDFLDAPGIKETALYPIYMSGKAGTYNYSDNDMTDAPGFLNLWLAKTYQEPAYTWYHKYYIENSRYEATVYDLLYYDPVFYQGEAPELLDYSYPAQAVTTMRHDFTDPLTSFVGFKGGENGAPHGDLDIGSFVYDVLGERWALDFGKEDYNLPGYWEINNGGQRWNYYRKNALGHNTLVIHPEDGGNQNVGVYSGIIESSLNNPGGGYSILDMSNAYQKFGVDVKRGFAYFDRTHLLIRDEFILKNSEDVYWQMHTDAEITISADKKEATLKKAGQEIMVRLFDEAGSDLEFTVMEAKAYDGIKAAAGQNINDGIQKLLIKSSGQKGSISVLMSPASDSIDNEFQVLPLSSWNLYDFSAQTDKPPVSPGTSPSGKIVKSSVSNTMGEKKEIDAEPILSSAEQSDVSEEGHPGLSDAAGDSSVASVPKTQDNTLFFMPLSLLLMSSGLLYLILKRYKLY